MRSTKPTRYEELPYTNNAHFTSHPLNLATNAWFHGLKPPDPTSSRVLELGCGRGGNLLPMAESLPGSHFVGVDQSPRQTAEAGESANALGMKNVEFYEGDLLELEDRFGEFDYILAHGVYSWVSHKVQETILQLCATRLSPDGIAYISYNTFPGWHYRGVVRDLLCFHVSDAEASAEDQVARARQFLEVVSRDIPDKEHPRSKLILEECELLARQSDGYVYHDQLEPENHPCYFFEFAAQAAAHGLQYVTEARMEPLISDVPSSAHLAISEAAGNDRVRYEQYLDFLVHRTFRRTILCRKGLDVQPKPTVDRLQTCMFKGIAGPITEDADLDSFSPLTFRTLDDVQFTSEHPAVKTTLATLHEMGPQAVSLEALLEQTAPRLDYDNHENFKPLLLDILLACYHREVVKAYLRAPEFFPQVSKEPVASPVARLQAGGDSKVTNCEHRSIDLSPLDRFLLTHMDGTRDRDVLVSALYEAVLSGQVEIESGKFDSTDESRLIAASRELFDNRSLYLARRGFLIA